MCHAVLMPAAALIVAAILGVEHVFEQLLGLQSSLAIVVEFLCGVLFLVLPRRGSR